MNRGPKLKVPAPCLNLGHLKLSHSMSPRIFERAETYLMKLENKTALCSLLCVNRPPCQIEVTARNGARIVKPSLRTKNLQKSLDHEADTYNIL